MANQENGGIKQLKLRIPMEVYVQLEKDSAEHREAPATRARHILVDQLMRIELNEVDVVERDRLRREMSNATNALRRKKDELRRYQEHCEKFNALRELGGSGAGSDDGDRAISGAAQDEKESKRTTAGEEVAR